MECQDPKAIFVTYKTNLNEHTRPLSNPTSTHWANICNVCQFDLTNQMHIYTTKQ